MTEEPASAHFSHPIKSNTPGGMDLRLQVIPKFGETLFALKDEENKGDLHFPEGDLLFGETLEEAVRRVLHDDLEVALDRYYLANMRSKVDAQGHWHLTLVCVAQATEPKKRSGVVDFSESLPPAGLVGWSEQDLRAALER